MEEELNNPVEAPQEFDTLDGEYINNNPAQTPTERRAAMIIKADAIDANNRVDVQGIIDQRAADAAYKAQQDEDQRSHLTDSALGVLKILPAAGEQLLQTMGDLGNLLEEHVTGDIGAIGVTSDFPFVEYYESHAEQVALGNGDLSTVEFPDVLPETERGSGAAIKGIGTFLVGFISLQKELAFLNATTKVAKVATAAGIGAVVDFTLFDPTEERLSNLVQSTPSIANPINEWLAMDEDESRLEGRLKQAIEGLGLGLAAEGIIKLLTKSATAIKQSRALRKEKKAFADAEEAHANKPNEEGGLDTPDVEPTVKPDGEPTVKPDGEPTVKPEVNTPDMKISIPKGKVAEFFDRISSGEPMHTSDVLIDFNSSRYDLGEIGGDPNAVKNIMNATTEVFQTAMDSAGKVVQTHDVTTRLARLVGSSAENVDKVFRELTDGKGLSARLLAADFELVNSGKRIQSLWKQVEADDARGDFSKVPELYQQIELHAAIQAEVKGSKREVARALNAMKIMKKTSDEGFDQFEEIIKNMPDGASKPRDLVARLKAAKGDPEALNKAISDLANPHWKRVVSEVVINGLLSGVKTHVINLTSNTLQVGLGLTDRIVGSAIGSARRAVGANAGDVITWHETAAFLYGTAKGAVDGVGLAIQAFKKSAPITDHVQRMENVGRNAIAVDAGQIHKWKASGDHGKEVLGHAINVLGTMVRLPSRMLITGDELFKSIAITGERHGLAIRNANKKADIKELSGAERKKYIKAESKRQMDQPTEEFESQTLEFARRQTFQEDTVGGARTFEKFINGFPLAKTFIIPFYKTPLNIFKQALLERSPLALVRVDTAPKLLKVMTDFDAVVVKGGQAADMKLAKLVVGGTMMTTAYSMWGEGKITGSKGGYRSSELIDGVPAYAMKINDEWVQYNRLDPLGTLFGLSADLSEAMADGWDDDEEFHANASMMVGVTMAAIMDLALNKTWMKGVSDLFELINKTSDSETNIEAGKKYIQKNTLNLVPFNSLLRSTAKANDDMSREAFTLMEQFRRNIPTLSNGLPPKRDIFGQPRVGEAHVVSSWNPFAASTKSTDPTELELARLSTEFTMPSKRMEKHQLTAEQYSRYLELGGSVTDPATGLNMKQTITQFISAPQYNTQGTDEFRVSTIKSIIAKYLSVGKQKLLAEDKELRIKVRTTEIERKGAIRGATPLDVANQISLQTLTDFN